MTPDDKALAERVLRRLCQGGTFVGVRFGYPTRFVIDFALDETKVKGELTLGVDTGCLVLPQSTPWPQYLEAVPDIDDARAMHILDQTKRKQIADIRLGDSEPHLGVTFESGETLFVWGSHPKYEPWEVRVLYSAATWLVVALPGDGLAVWAPDSYAEG